jgi:hypothetical protein
VYKVSLITSGIDLVKRGAQRVWSSFPHFCFLDIAENCMFIDKRTDSSPNEKKREEDLVPGYFGIL